MINQIINLSGLNLHGLCNCEWHDSAETEGRNKYAAECDKENMGFKAEALKLGSLSFFYAA